MEKLTSSVAENVQTTTAADDTSTTAVEISNILDHTQSVCLHSSDSYNSAIDIIMALLLLLLIIISQLGDISNSISKKNK